METTKKLNLTFESFFQIPDEGEIFAYNTMVDRFKIGDVIELICKCDKNKIDNYPTRKGKYLMCRSKWNKNIKVNSFTHYIQMLD